MLRSFQHPSLQSTAVFPIVSFGSFVVAIIRSDESLYKNTSIGSPTSIPLRHLLLGRSTLFRRCPDIRRNQRSSQQSELVFLPSFIHFLLYCSETKLSIYCITPDRLFHTLRQIRSSILSSLSEVCQPDIRLFPCRPADLFYCSIFRSTSNSGPSCTRSRIYSFCTFSLSQQIHLPWQSLP